MRELRAKLDALRAASGERALGPDVLPNRATGGLGPDLQSLPSVESRRLRLRALQAQLAQVGAVRRDARPSSRGLDDSALAKRLGAKVVAPGVLCKEQLLPESYRHGRVIVAASNIRAALTRLSVDRPSNLPGRCRELPRVAHPVFFDTETTGLAGGSGTVAFVLGLAWFPEQESGGLMVRQYLLSRFAGEARMLDLGAEVLGRASPVVTYNGKSFDAPLLATRCRLCRRGDPLQNAVHLDLLHPMRRAFSRTWGDCRLGTAEFNLLRFARRDDLPGHEAPAAWTDWLHRGNCSRLGKLLEHNAWDLISLAALAPILVDCQDDPVAFGADTAAVLGQDSSRSAQEMHRYLLANRSGLNAKGLRDLARRSRHLGEWEVAVEIWTELSAQRDVEATEHLAKYYEHRAKDLARARSITAELLRLQPEVEQHRARARRLDRRLSDQKAHDLSAARGTEREFARVDAV